MSSRCPGPWAPSLEHPWRGERGGQGNNEHPSLGRLPAECWSHWADGALNAVGGTFFFAWRDPHSTSWALNPGPWPLLGAEAKAVPI